MCLGGLFMKSVSKVLFSVVFIWLSVLNTPICSNSAVPTYSITYDKKMENVVEISFLNLMV